MGSTLAGGEAPPEGRRLKDCCLAALMLDCTCWVLLLIGENSPARPFSHVRASSICRVAALQKCDGVSIMIAAQTNCLNAFANALASF